MGRHRRNKEGEHQHGNRRFLDQRRAELLEGIGVPEASEFIPDPFQTDAVASVMNGEDTLVVAPTGAGKTYIAVEAIRGHLELGTKTVYTTPLKALSNSKYNDLKQKFEPKYPVGLLTGDRKIDTDSACVIATTEIYRNELYRSSERFSLVVLDEVHFIADPQRGPVWEESIILTPRSATLLMLSASISNAQEIADWIQEVRGKPCRIISETHRPVELRYAFLHPQFGVIPLRDEKGRILREVSWFYGEMGLDSTGTRLRRMSRSGDQEKRQRRGRGRGGKKGKR